ncbi:hypothetical protein FQN49_009008, partial [Arthroderma sp. PD_2]
MSSSQAVAASLMGPPPPDAVPERSRFDRDDHRQPDKTAQPSPAKEDFAAIQASTAAASSQQGQHSPDDASDRQTDQSDPQKQAAATTLLAQLLSSQPAAADQNGQGSSLQGPTDPPVSAADAE